jgi:hypothetical protein
MPMAIPAAAVVLAALGHWIAYEPEEHRDRHRPPGTLARNVLAFIVALTLAGAMAVNAVLWWCAIALAVSALTVALGRVWLSERRK